MKIDSIELSTTICSKSCPQKILILLNGCDMLRIDSMEHVHRMVIHSQEYRILEYNSVLENLAIVLNK